MNTIKQYFYPETTVRGFSSVDRTIQFYQRVNALLRKDMVVLDLGAGRGAAAYTERSEYKKALMTPTGKFATVIGVDIKC
ncbi:hypothetical protein [Halochromatium roseum]|uniref:hypothetical protein n=1 Tax=Halochromatium roseum TaxID=391920 RepID=UPI00191325C2|nr:hypothetical protein [Halochromatium roseum]MBK5940033.1 hypothetical protein [Halochromatium roseum]